MNSPVLDKLSVVLPYAARTDYNNHERLITALLPNIEALMAEGTLVKLPHSRRGYQHVFQTHVGNLYGHHPILRIGSQNPAICKGAVAFTLNPARYSSAELSTFHSILFRLLGDDAPAVLHGAKLQAMHSALDIQDLEVNSLVLSTKRSRNFETYSTVGDADMPGRTSGMYFGKLGSASRTCVYEKHTEQKYRQVEAMKAAKTEQEEQRILGIYQRLLDGKPVTRIECRWDKLNGLPLHLAHTMPNRFAMLDFRYIDLTLFDQSKEIGRELLLEAKLFISHVRAVGIDKALEDYRPSRTMHTRVKRLWDKSEIKLCDPITVFNETIDALKALPFFPREAFENPNQ